MRSHFMWKALVAFTTAQDVKFHRLTNDEDHDVSIQRQHQQIAQEHLKDVEDHLQTRGLTLDDFALDESGSIDLPPHLMQRDHTIMSELPPDLDKDCIDWWRQNGSIPENEYSGADPAEETECTDRKSYQLYCKFKHKNSPSPIHHFQCPENFGCANTNKETGKILDRQQWLYDHHESRIPWPDMVGVTCISESSITTIVMGIQQRKQSMSSKIARALKGAKRFIGVTGLTADMSHINWRVEYHYGRGSAPKITTHAGTKYWWGLLDSMPEKKFYSYTIDYTMQDDDYSWESQVWFPEDFNRSVTMVAQFGFLTSDRS